MADKDRKSVTTIQVLVAQNTNWQYYQLNISHLVSQWYSMANTNNTVMRVVGAHIRRDTHV
jgi:hypothetical protein